MTELDFTTDKRRKYVYPEPAILLSLMSEMKECTAVARRIGIPYGAFDAFLRRNPELRKSMKAMASREQYKLPSNQHLVALANTTPSIKGLCQRIGWKEAVFYRYLNSRPQLAAQITQACTTARRKASKTIDKECEWCATSFEIYPSQTTRFCCTPCYHAFLARTETRPCTYCGADIIRTPSDFRKSKNGLYFCNHTCRARYRTQNATRNRFSTKLTAHQRDIYGDSCLLCGWSRYVEYCHLIPAAQGGTIHPDNIVSLCPNHHTLFDRNMLTPKEKGAMAVRLKRAKASGYALIPSRRALTRG